MSYKIYLVDGFPIVETTYIGPLSKEEVDLAGVQELALAKFHAITLFLKNCTFLEGIHSIAELYLLAGTLEKWTRLFTIKKAIVNSYISIDSCQIQQWEATCRKHGVEVRLFGERSIALEWLLTWLEPPPAALLSPICKI